MVEVTQETDWTVIRLEGDVDVATAPAIRDVVEQVQGEGRRYVRFNATGVDFMDSQGLNLLAGAHKRAQALGGRIEVVGASPELRTILKATGLEWLLAPTGDTGPPTSPPSPSQDGSR